MNVLFFTRSFYPQVGGVEKHIFEVSKRLLREGHDVTVITEATHDHHKQSVTSNQAAPLQGLTIYRIPIATTEKRKKYVIWKWLWEHRDLIQKADVVHCHDVFFWYLPFRFIYPAKRVFTTFHGYETVYPPKKNAIRMRKLSKRLSHGTINVGDFIRKWYGTPADITMYGGIEKIQNSGPKAHQPLAENFKFQISNKKLRIAFVGRIEKDNGVEIYSEALRLLQEKKVPYEFHAYGDGNSKPLFERYGKVHGWVDDTSRPLAEADIIFASSYLSILDALSHKIIIVSVFDNPLKKDYLEMAPFSKYIIISDSPEDIYKSIKDVSLNPNRSLRMVEGGYEWVKNQTWDTVTENYLKLWKKNSKKSL